MSIVSFKDSATEVFFLTGQIKKSARWHGCLEICRRKLDMLYYATTLMDLSSPPGNKLEALKGKLSGFYSIRVNKQWRIIFIWTAAGPTAVQICDYH